MMSRKKTGCTVKTNSSRIVWWAFIALSIAGVARAHNLFVLIENRNDGTDNIDVIFEHSPFPGKGTYNQPLLDRGKTWIERTDDEEAVHLELDEVTRLGKKFLQTETRTAPPRAIVHSCEWGVYKGRMDYFHGKYLDVSSAEEANRLARTAALPLDIVVTFQSDGLKVTVLFEGKPLPDQKIWVWSPGGKETKQTTNSEGTLVLRDLAPGLHSFAAIHLLDEPGGEFGGESFKGLMHGTTCSLRWPLK